MPLSAATLDQLERTKEERPMRDIPVIRFVGLAYSPRIEWLTQLKWILAQRHIHLELHTSKSETSNEEYWRLLSETDILVTTTMQVCQPQYDWSWEPQVLFRYTEALAVGTALVATDVPGLERHLHAGVHYAVYESLEDCADVVEGLLASQAKRELLANHGHYRLVSLVESRSFWSQVDASLGRNSMK